jgi:hypothetical protein
MKRMVLSDAALGRLVGVEDIVELCDPSGRVIGRFRPAIFDDPAAQPRISDDEMDQRLTEGGGRSLAEIMADWETRT